LDIAITNNEKLVKIKDTFSMFSDPLDMMAYLIDIGKTAHNLNSNEKNDDNIIIGCTSKAWIVVSNSEDDFFCIKTDSDSHIVSGLLYILSLSVNGQSKNYIDNIDAVEVLASIGLDGKITSQRTNGFISAVETLKGRIY
tara:strand:+ start:339 stop:758 length:420 start_codon:yes stop_codon:yes gene_type:complete